MPTFSVFAADVDADKLIKTMLALSDAKKDWDEGEAKLWSDEAENEGGQQDMDVSDGEVVQNASKTLVAVPKDPYAFSWDTYGSNPWAPVDTSKKKSQNAMSQLMTVANSKKPDLSIYINQPPGSISYALGLIKKENTVAASAVQRSATTDPNREGNVLTSNDSIKPEHKTTLCAEVEKSQPSETEYETTEPPENETIVPPGVEAETCLKTEGESSEFVKTEAGSSWLADSLAFLNDYDSATTAAETTGDPYVKTEPCSPDNSETSNDATAAVSDTGTSTSQMSVYKTPSEKKKFTAADYPVSSDGACPYCKSTDVVYIVVSDKIINLKLPIILRRLLKYKLAYKMPVSSKGLYGLYFVLPALNFSDHFPRALLDFSVHQLENPPLISSRLSLIN